MNYPDLAELARQGDPHAIALVLKHHLGWQDTAFKVSSQGALLQILLEFETVLSPDQVVTPIRDALLTLNVPNITSIKLYGRKLRSSTVAWQEQFSLTDASTDHPNRTVEQFVICGLGSLGQYCLVNLRKFASPEFGIQVAAIDQVMPATWEAEELEGMVTSDLILGDCRREDVLARAGVRQSRAIVIVTSSEEVNIETAIAARRLNPDIRVVIRSSRQNLNNLLAEQLGNFVAFEPTELSAATFALAGLGESTAGFFTIGNYRFRVIEETIRAGDYRFDNLPVGKLHKRGYRLISIPTDNPTTAPHPYSFFQWQAEDRVQAGDRIAYVEVTEEFASQQQPRSSKLDTLRDFLQTLVSGNLQQQLTRLWQWFQEKRSRLVIGAGLLTALFLWTVATLMLRFYIPGITWQVAMSAAVILLLGGYGDVFGGLDPAPDIPWWVQTVCLLITIVSLLFVLGVLGLIADSVISSRFDFLRQRPKIPKRDHIVLLGFRRVGRRVAAMMQAIQQPIVALEEQLLDPTVPSGLPLIVGNFLEDLAKANVSTAKSVILATEDQMLNLELALMARDAARHDHRNLRLIIRTYDQRFSRELATLLPDARALCAYELAAEAFAGAAFGENMLSLFRLSDRTILVTDYIIETGDTLADKLLAQVAYGYRVVPVFHQRREQVLAGETIGNTMPSDEIRLNVGDRLVVLASINGLQRIERNEIIPPMQWRLFAEPPRVKGNLIDAGNRLENISGCDLKQARTFMDSLPTTIDLALYPYQANRLQHELKKLLPITLVPLEDSPRPQAEPRNAWA